MALLGLDLLDPGRNFLLSQPLRDLGLLHLVDHVFEVGPQPAGLGLEEMMLKLITQRIFQKISFKVYL